MEQELRPTNNTRRAQRRRLLLMMGLAFALIAWGQKAATVLSDGWYCSVHALEEQRQIDAASERISALQREVTYARTSEGRDVEAKRRFGVGPDDEIWITVDATEAAPRRPEPQSVADRLNAWLEGAGARFVDHLRELGAVFGYWVGLRHVDACVAVPVIEDEPVAQVTDEAPEAADADGEAAGDGTQR